ncbi:MAG: Na/Pi cotransporter family protein [Fibromonadaceae bacterium]|nr:Na/Pi cotransporter family protein [Fibromonadaceae bacterium]
MNYFSDYASILLSLAGGVGIFLLGMKFLSEGLQTVAGNKLRSLIGMATNNRVFGVGLGLLVTGIIQSSSITTVLVVSFVDGGLMTLAQAVGVIMGANIGTTITGWILTIKIDQYGLPLAGIAAIVYIFSKKQTVKYIALGALGLGCVFLGLLFMKSAVEPIKDYPEFVAMFHAFQANTYFGVLKCAAVGCILTLMVQSSSVTIGITMVLASQGLISFHTAAALVLGENVGTTITAVLASLGANNNARRAAYFHALFNMTGVFYITLLFHPFVSFVEWELGFFFGLENLADTKNVSFGIAAVHSTFNVFNAAIFLIPCRLIARILESDFFTRVLTNVKMLREETEQVPELEALLTMVAYNKKDSSYVKFIEIENRIQKVLIYMGKQLKISTQNLKHCIENTEKNSPEINQLFEMEKQCDRIKTELVGILSSFTGGEETITIQRRIFAYERILDHLESTSDYMAQVAKLRLRLLDNKTDFLDYQKHGLAKLNLLISNSINKLLPDEESQQMNNKEFVDELEKDFAVIKDTIRTMRVDFWEKAGKSANEPVVNDTYSNMLTSYRKIRDHLRSAGNAISGVDRD